MNVKDTRFELPVLWFKMVGWAIAYWFSFGKDKRARSEYDKLLERSVEILNKQFGG